MMHSTEYEAPLPLPAAINTAGAEDSPFILPDGNTLYFFFTPDVRVPPEGQILDEVSGVWVSRRQNNQWNNAERVWLQDPGKLALDGAVCIQGEEMWFASAREGYEGVNMFTAIWKKDRWAKWRYVGDRLMKEIQIGEVHLHKDTLYFHSPRPGGKGNYDIWTTCREGKNWTDPVNISAVNTEAMDGYPYVSADQSMLWFTRMHEGSPAIFRSKNMEGAWSTPELVVSRFAGEPTLDAEGNLYFVHHYYENDIMIEADIYMAKKR